LINQSISQLLLYWL